MADIYNHVAVRCPLSCSPSISMHQMYANNDVVERVGVAIARQRKLYISYNNKHNMLCQLLCTAVRPGGTFRGGAAKFNLHLKIRKGKKLLYGMVGKNDAGKFLRMGKGHHSVKGLGFQEKKSSKIFGLSIQKSRRGGKFKIRPGRQIRTIVTPLTMLSFPYSSI